MSELNYSYYNVIVWNSGGQYKMYHKDILNGKFNRDEYDYLLFLKFESGHPYLIPSIGRLIESLQTIYNSNNNTFIVLTPRKTPPLYTASEDEFVFSFSCNFRYFKELTGNINKANLLSTDLLFYMLDKITADQTPIEKILVRQFPFEANVLASQERFNVIIPHKGGNEFLKTVLYFLKQIKGAKVLVGIDQEISTDLLKLKSKYTDIEFYQFTNNPVGPYVIRNKLIEQSHEELLFFQDSDDIPCGDRFDRIADYMQKNGSDLCGSHELRFDYLTRTIRAVRFPTDVMAALKVAPWHSLLHGSSAITRAAFYKSGKLSEERIFGNDTKFLLNCYFMLNNIINVDEFLYIRKIRPDSLTISASTKIGSTVRQGLVEKWNFDFEQIKNGNLRLEDSSLVAKSSDISTTANKL